MGEILWLITARSGSSLPDKNIKKLGGLPLMAYRIQSALALSESEDVWLSTDSHRYAKVGEKYGVTVPFIRPDELATDTASSTDVILHAMHFAESSGLQYKYIGLLQPTSPFVYLSQLKEAIQLIKNTNIKSVVSCKSIDKNTFFIQKHSKFLDDLAQRFKTHQNLNRQQFRNEISPSGGIFLMGWEDFKNDKTFYSDKCYAQVLPDINSIDIDKSIDFLWAEFLLEQKIVDLKLLF